MTNLLEQYPKMKGVPGRTMSGMIVKESSGILWHARYHHETGHPLAVFNSSHESIIDWSEIME